jgi:hypothetical protein
VSEKSPQCTYILKFISSPWGGGGDRSRCYSGVRGKRQVEMKLEKDIKRNAKGKKGA